MQAFEVRERKPHFPGTETEALECEKSEASRARTQPRPADPINEPIALLPA